MRYATVTIDGFADLDRQLAALERGPTDDEKRAALMKGGNVIADAERRLIHDRSGNLSRSITVITGGQAAMGIHAKVVEVLIDDGNNVYIGPRIGVTGADGWYGGLVEFGTSRTAAKPFARPAAATAGEPAAKVVVMDLARSVLRLAA